MPPIHRGAAGEECEPPRDGRQRMHWVRPELVARVEFRERSSDGLLRHPTFQGLREDVSASSVVRGR